MPELSRLADKATKPVLVDWFCGAGGATAGFQRAGFYVIGVDNLPQPNYCGDAFVQADAITLLRATKSLTGVAAQAASPPCPHYSVLNRSWNVDKAQHPDWIGLVRAELQRLGLPFVIENVMGARSVMHDPVKLCGSMFHLPVERHRLFECNGFMPERPRCNHALQRALWPLGFPALRSDRTGKRARVVGVYGTGGGKTKDLVLWKWAMNVPWMQTKREVSNSIPPAYTDFIGRAMISAAGNAAS